MFYVSKIFRQRMKKVFNSTFLLIFLFLFPIHSYPFTLSERVKEYTLDNGLKVLMVERHQSPTVSLFICFKVGSVDEGSGMTGTAHLLEHMLFKGTETLGTKNYTEEKKLLDLIDEKATLLDQERMKGEKADSKKVESLTKEVRELESEHRKFVVKDEVDSIYLKNGAEGLNAMTGNDTTTYVVSLPSNRIELWARIESDRILNPVLREFYSEREVVREERRQSYESQSDRKLMEVFLAAAFQAHPYRNPIIGWDTDLGFLKRGSTLNFFRSHYAPNNAVIAVVGDINPEEVLSLIKRYFGRIPAQPITFPPVTPEPEQRGEKRVKLVFDANPQLIIGYHKPTLPHFDDYCFDVIDAVLSQGRTSRLYKRLVEKEKLAVSVETANGLPGARYPNLFTIFATPRSPHTTRELEKAIYQELERLKREKVSERELTKIKNQLKTSRIYRLQSNSGIAHELAYNQTVANDWRYMEKHLEIIEQITPQDIMRTVREYLKEENRTVAELVKKDRQQATGNRQ
jgi:predicted Zn-dependent peptidase